MTAAEEANLDLPGRMSFANAVATQLLGYARSLDTYAGAYIDQLRGGMLVVLLTESDPDVEADLLKSLPTPSKGLEVREVAVTERQLRDALTRVADAFPTLHVIAAGIDHRSNGLHVRVLVSDLTAAQSEIESAQSALGVAVSVTEGDPADLVEQVCTTRDNCHTPMKAGIRIYRGPVADGFLCTMGFHIRQGSDEEFLTAGHCGWNVTPNYWTHPTYGTVGAELANQYGNSGTNRRDAMRVDLLSDAQASDDIYADSPNVTGSRNPIQGEAICASLGARNRIDCGTVFEDYFWWTGLGCGLCMVYGADSNGIDGIDGDSGSPLYVVGGGSSEPATGLGIWNTFGGYFARLQDVLNYWGSVLVT